MAMDPSPFVHGVRHKFAGEQRQAWGGNSFFRIGMLLFWFQWNREWQREKQHPAFSGAGAGPARTRSGIGFDKARGAAAVEL